MRNLIILFFIARVALPGQVSAQKGGKSPKTKKPSEAAKTPMLTKEDSMAYAIGMDLARNLIQYQAEINPDKLYEGMTGYSAQSSTLSPEVVQQVLTRFQDQVNKRVEAAQPQPAAGPIAVGMQAPELALPNPSGDTVRLSSLRGKYVLIDFWASWCKPCRLENPNVVRMYGKYKNKGFEILGVSLDGTREAWVKAIEADGLTWPHMSDLKLWRSIAAQTYDVHAIPHTVLVDPFGKVVALNLRGPALEAKLAELLGG